MSDSYRGNRYNIEIRSLNQQPDTGVDYGGVGTDFLPSDDEEVEKERRERRRQLAELLARRVLEEEAQTGTLSSGRVPLSHIDEALSKPPEEDRLDALIRSGEVPHPAFVPIAPDQTVDQIWQRAQEDRAGTTPRPAVVNPSANTNPMLAGNSRMEKLRSLAKTALEPVKQFGYNLGGAAMGTPRAVLAALSAPGAYAARKAGYEGPAKFTESLLHTAAQDKENLRRTVGAKPEDELNFLERLAGTTGANVLPIKGVGVLAPTAISTGVQTAIPAITSPAPAAPRRRGEDPLDRALRELNQRDNDADRVVESIGGPTKIKDSELATLGGLAAMTIGMIFAPAMFAKFKTARIPILRPNPGAVTPREVLEAAPGTKAISTPTDLARTYDDVNAGVIRLARRAGVDPAAVTQLHNNFRIQTRSAARSIADSAVANGHAETPAFQFRSKVPLIDLARLETPQVTNYLHALDTVDDLLLAGTKVQNLPANRQILAGPPMVRGLTLQDAFQQVHALERANPGLKQISLAYRDNLRAMRRFESTGEYATLSKADLKRLGQERPNMVPFRGERVMDDPRVQRGSPFQSLADTMQTNLRHRMENEVVGQYIDAVRKVQPDMFKRVTHKQLTDNPHWKKNTVTMWRRGKPEHYTTDPFLADVLKIDPYYMVSNAQNIGYITKRALETGSTGMLAPWFAVTSMLRSWQISKYTAPGGYRASTLLGSTAAIPQQLYPQMAKAISSSLDRGSGGWLRSVIGSSNVDALSLRLAHAYDNSLFAQMQSMGTHTGSILQQQAQAQNRLATAISKMNGPMKRTWEGYSALLQAVHNAPAFNFVRRNVKTKDKHLLAMEARNLTGDPRIGGQYFGGSGRPIRFETDSRVSHTAGKIVKGYGIASEFARTTVPWFNVTEQGIKRIGQAYLENPAKFTGRMWLYAMTPAATLYMASRALDKDPNGRSYSDYMMNGRSGYNRMMNWYIPIPGSPAEDGIEFPRFHEMTIAAHLMEVALDHAFRSAIFKEGEDFARASQSFGSIALVPPMPPIVNATLATQGMVGPQGVFGGETYKKRVDPFDQTGGLPSSVELFVRAIAGGIADVVGAGAASFAQTPREDGALRAAKNFLKDAGKRMIQKTPVLRDITGIKPPVTGNTDIVDELFKKQRAIDQLLRFETTGGEEVNTKGSKTGQIIAEKMLGKPLPSENAGITQPEPTNPLYQMFADEVHNRFKKDAPRDSKGKEQGAVGFKSLWNRYGVATKHLSRLRAINSGNWSTWQRQLEERPEQLEYLEAHNVDYKNPVAVRNHYEYVRQDAARAILFAIRATERDFSLRLGRPIKIEDLDPFGKGMPEATVRTPY